VHRAYERTAGCEDEMPDQAPHTGSCPSPTLRTAPLPSFEDRDREGATAARVDATFFPSGDSSVPCCSQSRSQAARAAARSRDAIKRRLATPAHHTPGRGHLADVVPDGSEIISARRWRLTAALSHLGFGRQARAACDRLWLQHGTNVARWKKVAFNTRSSGSFAVAISNSESGAVRNVGKTGSGVGR